MTQIFRLVLLTALCLVKCRSASIMQQGCVLAPMAALPLLSSLVPAALSSDAGADEDELEHLGDMEPEEFMTDMDLDEDGFLSLSELVPEDEGLPPKELEAMKKLFEAADGDKDGKLSLDEIPAMIKAFESMDEGEGASEEM
mmetsp:Transcript_109932/g.212824  ORF Transcript_109932/g.212824 Transcript_109932/m.212824 type:complete len:142 (+) Transcript_109932:102-527(+)